GRPLPEVREVPIFEVDAILLCRPAGAVDVHGCELVPDPSAPGVELGPDDVTLVETHFDVMVAGAERPQLFDRASLLLRRERVPTPPLRMVLGEPTFRCHAPSVVALTYPGWDATLDLVKQWVEAVGEILRTEVGLDCDHSASDVDADGGGDDRVPGRDDRADGGSDAEVGVGHERDVPVDDRKPSRAARLRERLLVELGGPRQQPRRDLDRSHGCSVAWRRCAWY